MTFPTLQNDIIWQGTTHSYVSTVNDADIVTTDEKPKNS